MISLNLSTSYSGSIPALLLPPNNSSNQFTTKLVFKWQPLKFGNCFLSNVIAEGVVCDLAAANRALTLFLDTGKEAFILFILSVNPPVQIAGHFLPTMDNSFVPQVTCSQTSLQLRKLELQVNTTYYWYLSVDNGVSNTSSPVQMFTTREYSCANTGCVNGVCNDSNIIPTCTCK